MSEWQPIETAPKDGNVILGYIPYMSWGCEVIEWYGGQWVVNGESPTFEKPTHWMPLPEPPKENENE